MLGMNLDSTLHFNTTFTRLLYSLIIVIVAFVALVSEFFIFSQAVRTAPKKEWTRNANVIVIGAAYVLILVISLAFCLKRWLSVRLKLARIPKGRIATGKDDLPKVVHNFIEQEFLRSCTIAYVSLPKVSHQEGWGAPGTKYEGTRFRTAILDTVGTIDAASRAVIPSMPPLSPHVSLERHLRHILPLVTHSGSATHCKYTSNNDIHVACTTDLDNEGDTDMVCAEAYFRRYTAAVEQAKHSEREMSEEVFEEALVAGEVLKGILDAYKSVLDEQAQ